MEKFEITCVKLKSKLEGSFHNLKNRYMEIEADLILSAEQHIDIRSLARELYLLEKILFVVSKLHCINAVSEFLDSLKNSS